MKLLTPNELSTHLLAAATDTQPPQSQLQIKGVQQQVVIQGAILEAAVETKNAYLVFMTDDIPYEDTLRITLISKSFEILDIANLGAAYTTGSFQFLDLNGEHHITFSFFGETPWTLTLLERKQLLIPFFSEPKGVSRPFGFQHYFKISGKPAPAR